MISITGYYQEGLAAAGITNNNMQTTGVEDTFNWTNGNHQIKTGGSFFYNMYRENGIYYGSGLATFSGTFTGNAIADFLEGRAASLRQNTGVYHRFYQPDPSVPPGRLENLAPAYARSRRSLGSIRCIHRRKHRRHVRSQRTSRNGSRLLHLVCSRLEIKGVPDGIVPTKWHDFVPAPRLCL